MSATLLAAVLILGQVDASQGASASAFEAASAETASSDSNSYEPRPPRSGRQLQADVLAAMKLSSPTAAADPADHALELISLCHDLRADTELPVVERERLRSMVRNRLELIAEKLSKRKPKKQAEKQTASADKPAGAGKVESIEKPGQDRDVLGQFGGPGGRNPGGAGGPGGGGFGGFGGGGNRPGQQRDYGQDLVDLIKKTIAPESWDDRGGPGTIYYYRPLQVLVIRQTSEVHHSVGGLIGGMRRNGP